MPRLVPRPSVAPLPVSADASTLDDDKLEEHWGVTLAQVDAAIARVLASPPPTDDGDIEQLLSR